MRTNFFWVQLIKYVMGILVSKVLGVTAAAYGDIFCARKPQILFYYDVI